MHRWHVGNVEVVRIEASDFTLPATAPLPSWAVPDYTSSVDLVPLAFSALAVRSGDRRIVVDPWIVDDAPRSRPDAQAVVDALLGQLAAAGFAVDLVDTVVDTHIDGMGWNTRPSAGGGGWIPTFPRARYLFPAAELAAVANGVPLSGGDQIGPLLDADVVDVIDPAALPYQVTPEVVLVDGPGHNAGHHLVRIESDGELAVYPGHLVLTLDQVDDPAAAEGDVDPALATATRASVLGELADRHGVLLTTIVGGPGGGRVERRDGGFRLVAAHEPA